MDRSVVAENYVLPRVLHSMESTPHQLCLKIIAPDDALDIADTAPHDTALTRSLGAEQLQQPDVRRDKDSMVAHMRDTQSKVVNERLIQTLIVTQYKDPNCGGKTGVHAAIGINFGGQSIDWLCFFPGNVAERLPKGILKRDAGAMPAQS